MNVWSRICLNGNISKRFFNENMNTKLYVNKKNQNEKLMRKRIYINER